jgi:hypothetical protein
VSKEDKRMIREIEDYLIEKHGSGEKERIKKGVSQARTLWKPEDGSGEDFKGFCKNSFIGSQEELKDPFNRIEKNLEILSGSLLKISLELKKPLHLDIGDITPIDMIFGQYNPAAHLAEDFFKNKLAFMMILNFPYYSLEEKLRSGADWTRQQWANARMGDQFISRVPPEINQKISDIFVQVDRYTSEYNIFVGNLIDADENRYFPKDMKLISHWGLRDEIKARYKDKNGLHKQEMLFKVMNRIIKQDIPENVINSPEYLWDPFENKVYKDGREIKYKYENNRRYIPLLDVFRGIKEEDKYYPNLSTHIKRKFEFDREIPEQKVEKLFHNFLSSELTTQVGETIRKRIGRNLRPFDIWYDGFKPSPPVEEEKLDKIVSSKYPNIEAFAGDIKNILIRLGFSEKKASFVSERIKVEPARGAGHAWGAEMREGKSHLRTRVPKGGMNYKGFNTAMHELGHCVEQTLTLHDVDYYIMHGIPNTAFTEAFAFLFQNKDFEILEVSEQKPQNRYLQTLATFWNTYEIMGVSMVDMRIWNWMYDNPESTSEELKEATLNISKDIWNKYYSKVLGVKDEVILGIYSHMINSALYLPDYPLGFIIQFQLDKFIEGKNLGEEMERICSIGRVTPDMWMNHAVGDEISIKPMLGATAEALKIV